MDEQIFNLIKAAGVVGAGGAGFPSHVKVGATADHVIVNGAECEPLLRVDQQLMVVEAAQMVRGLEAVMASTGAAQGTIALKGKYHDAIDALSCQIKGKPIQLFILDDFYPAGDEHVTVYEVTGKIIPEGGIPLKVGCVVNNVETLVNVAQALDGQPVVDTYLTITGDVPRPMTVKLPIGTSIREALALAGRTDMRDRVLVEGGPMMGSVVENFDQPITKTTKGLIVLGLDHPMIKTRLMSLEFILKQAKAACIQCFRCTDMCPRHMLGHRLSPHKIMRAMNYLEADEEILKMAFSCTECGACEYACSIMNLSPRRVNGMLKKQLGQKGIKPTPPEKPEVVIPTRNFMKIPVKRLIAGLGLGEYNVPAPLTDTGFQPNQVVIPLKQHVGAPAQPVVTVGQRVSRGCLIAGIPEGALGANVHASIDGIVREIGSSITIERDGGAS